MMLAYFGGLFFSPYDVLMIPGLLLGVYAQLKLMSCFGRYSKMPVQSGISGAQAARNILDAAGLHQVPVEEVPGHLSDHYDPIKRALFLSTANFRGHSVAAVGVAAHEAGHALQHKEAYAPLQLRSMLAPATQIASGLWWIVLLAGLIIRGPWGGNLIQIAIGAFALVTLFSLITLPVEFDASRRAKDLLRRMGMVQGDEGIGVSKVLNAAAMTYVAGTVSAALELARLLLMTRGDDRD